jgi:NADH-quinone oxidoreductase subunit L
MYNLLWLIPFLPFLVAIILIAFGSRMPKVLSGGIGAGGVGIAAIITIVICINFLISPPDGYSYTQTLWSWIDVANVTPAVSLHLDALSLVMMFVITFVGFFILLYSTEYMLYDEAYARFFTYMNLFVGSMLILVLGDNLVLLLLGWEGVGLCSYLLIGFWYRKPGNGYAARKAFVVTRVGDIAMLIGIFLLFMHTGTMHIHAILDIGARLWVPDSAIPVAASLLMLGGAVGKSAQLPLQVWLPDAMAGPTPTSALIHAATMVTAGVYLIARMHVIFELAPAVLTIVAIVGVVTALIAGFSALTQTDIKRILAYSTISQIGYMFLALGVGAYAGAMFHFMTHAFFKALLFLGAGAIIHALHDEQNILRMGGIRKDMPVIFWTFLIGCASLAAIPLVTSGFYSKELILWKSFSSEFGSTWFYMLGVLGAFITALYTFRMVFLVFYGERKTGISHVPGRRITIPLLVLAFFSTIAGFIELPHTMGDITLFSNFVTSVLPATPVLDYSLTTEFLMQVIAALFVALGIYSAYGIYIKNPSAVENLTASPAGKAVYTYWSSGWGFDWLYDKVFVQPAVFLARINKHDFIDSFVNGVAFGTEILHRVFTKTQTGKLRWYATALVIGAIGVITLAVFL